jgi:hypothetical protein
MESQVSDLTDSFVTTDTEYPIENHPDDHNSFLRILNSRCIPEKEIIIDNLIKEFQSFFPDADSSLENLADFCRFKFHPARVSLISYSKFCIIYYSKAFSCSLKFRN